MWSVTLLCGELRYRRDLGYSNLDGRKMGWENSPHKGHADMKMTARYSHLAPNFKRIAANMINLTDKGRKRVGAGATTDAEPVFSTN